MSRLWLLPPRMVMVVVVVLLLLDAYPVVSLPLPVRKRMLEESRSQIESIGEGQGNDHKYGSGTRILLRKFDVDWKSTKYTCSLEIRVKEESKSKSKNKNKNKNKNKKADTSFQIRAEDAKAAADTIFRGICTSHPSSDKDESGNTIPNFPGYVENKNNQIIVRLRVTTKSKP